MIKFSELLICHGTLFITNSNPCDSWKQGAYESPFTWTETEAMKVKYFATRHRVNNMYNIYLPGSKSMFLLRAALTLKQCLSKRVSFQAAHSEGPS
jgi:hypothetical protein